MEKRRPPSGVHRGQLQGSAASGRLRIGDNWNAITIIALSQNNPLKAIAEFVENSIDARAQTVTVIRGRERGETYLKIVDDGEGVPRNPEGAPDFKYVATHIGDSLKRRLKAEGMQGIQGEFGIGLLSFWTVGERMTLSSSGADGKTWQMEMTKDEPGYTIVPRRTLFSHRGTELLVRPLLPGLRQLSGEKIQNYLAAELRDRIRRSGVRIRIIDRTAKKELEVQPRQYTGRLLHEFTTVSSDRGEVSLELYLNDPGTENHVSLFKSGTRVVASLAEIGPLDKAPWNTGFLQGMVDAPFLPLTPGSRTGVILDESFDAFLRALAPVEEKLIHMIAEEREAEEEQASRNILKSVQKAFKEAFLTLPPDDYNWFDLHTGARKSGQGKSGDAAPAAGGVESTRSAAAADPVRAAQSSGEDTDVREFFEYPGPLHSAVISPASVVMKVNTERGFRCVARDKQRRPVERGLDILWGLHEGQGTLSNTAGEIVTFKAPEEPGLCVLEARVSQGETTVTARSLVTVSETLIEKAPGSGDSSGKGLPGYTFLRAPVELWRSRYDEANNLVVINNGHRDYVYAAQKHARKLKYICRLFCKELVLANFPGFDSRELIERVIELSMYTEEHLK